jgi:hypothetical protein
MPAQLPDDAKCPFHPCANHEWGDANNNDKKPVLAIKTKDKSPKVKSNTMKVDDGNVASDKRLT